MCLGLVVLLAIVYVLSRSGSQDYGATFPGGGGSSSGGGGDIDYSKIDMGRLREEAFQRTPPHIIECAAADAGGDQSACHLPSAERFAAVKQKG